MLITPNKLEEFNQSLDFSFNLGVQTAPSFWKSLATEVPSKSKRNVYPFLSGIPGLREWVGPRVVNNIAARNYVLENKHFEDTLEVDRNEFEDDQVGIYSNFAQMLGQQVTQFPDRMIASAMEAGTTSLGWDGQFFFDVDHPVNPDSPSAGVNSNKLVGAQYDIAVADPLVPFANARAAMSLWKRDDGEQMGVMGNLLMVHPNEEKFARQIANASITAQAINSSAAGVSNVFMSSVEVIVNPYLKVTTGRPWYLLATNGAIKPFLWQTRKAAELVALTNITDDNVFRHRKFVWGVDLRAAVGYTFPFLAFRMSAS